MADVIRPYRAAFASRFQLMLQYRAAAVAGFITQCWWGAIKVMVLAAFYGGASAAAATPIALAQAITYTWLGQALFAMLPWTSDPHVSEAMRSGSVGYDRLRPIDIYALWYVGAGGWLLARVLPRAALMLMFAGIALPLLGLAQWAWQPPASFEAAMLFSLSVMLALLLSSAVIVLMNVAVVVSVNGRGINTLVPPLLMAFSGALFPLALLPDGMRAGMLIQPFAGLLDIPICIYFGNLVDRAALAALGLQLFWIIALILLGRVALLAAMRRLEVQGG